MLVLSRFEAESIIISPPGCGRIKVTVVTLGHGKVRIGVDAPPDTQIHRSEVQDRIDAGEPAPRRRDGA